MKKQNNYLSGFLNTLVQQGRRSFCFNEACAYHGGTKVAARLSLYRLLKANKLFSPKHDFFVIVPVEHQMKGSVPSLWFIDAYMNSIESSYYIGLLSAAALHGAAHQQPQVLQVMVQKQLAPVNKKETRIYFYKTLFYDEVFLRSHKTPYGYVKVSSPELTMLDLFKFSYASGGLNTIATVMTELYALINIQHLRKVLDIHAKVSYVQRLGYVSSVLGLDKVTAVCLDYLNKQKRLQFVSLNVERPANDATRDNTWKIIINDTIESDI